MTLPPQFAPICRPVHCDVNWDEILPGFKSLCELRYVYPYILGLVVRKFTVHQQERQSSQTD